MMGLQNIQQRIAEEQARQALLASIANGGQPMGGPGTEYTGPAPGEAGYSGFAGPPIPPMVNAPDGNTAMDSPLNFISADSGPRTPQSPMQGAFSQAFGGESGPPIPPQYQDRINAVRELISPGPLYQQYMQAISGQQEPVHGAMGHVKSALRGLALKGLPGLIYGAVDPSAVNWSFKQAQAQNLLPGVQAEEHGRVAALGRAKEIAEMTGFDPITGQRTPMADYRAAMASVIPSRIANANSLIKSREQKSDLAELNTILRAQKQGGRLSQEQIDDIADQYGIVLPSNFDPGKSRLDYDETGAPVVINMTTGVSTPVMTTTGDRQQSYKPVQEQNKQNRADTIARGMSDRLAETKRQHDVSAGFRERELTLEENKTADAQAEKEFSPFEKDRSTKVKARAEEIKTEMRKQAAATGGAAAPTGRNKMTAAHYNQTITTVPKGWTAEAWKKAVDAEIARTKVIVE